MSFFEDIIKTPKLDLQRFEDDIVDLERDGEYVRTLRLDLIKSLSSNRNITSEYVPRLGMRKW